MITRLAGPNANVCPGGEVVVDDALARALVAGGYAVYVESPDEQATAPVEARETAVGRRKRAPRRAK